MHIMIKVRLIKKNIGYNQALINRRNQVII